MSGIHVISASAGTGKTTRLAKELTEALTRSEARPEGILATTFTRKAAAELQERARGALIQAGRPEDAQRLGAARIGTVNSVCGALVQDYALDLGLSPSLKTVDEHVSARMLAEAVSQGLTDDDAAVVQDLTRRLEPLRKTGDDDGWHGAVRAVVQLARANGLDDAGLAGSADRSVAGLLALLPPAGDTQAIEARLRAALEQFAAVFPTLPKTTDAGRKAFDRVRAALDELRAGNDLSWSTWVALQKLAVGSPKTNPVAAQLADAVIVAAAQDLEHPHFRADLEGYVRLVFRLAGRALGTYAERKRLSGLIDFIDQELHALHLLDRPAVQERLRDELDLVLVDEFQDTSPLQLAIFLKLARLAKRTIWVGDQKQAIFGFRGTDPALMTAALAAIEHSAHEESGPFAGGRTEPLNESWRSRPELVRLTSDVFVQAFATHGMPEALVRIEPGRPEEPPGLGPVVELWPLEGGNKAEYLASTASCVQRLLADPTVRVRDRVTNEPRALRPGDVAVLVPKNDGCAEVAHALQARGVRSVLPRVGLLKTLEGQVLLAALRVWVSPRNRLARAELSRILDGATNEESWFAGLVERTPPAPRDGSRRPEGPLPETPGGLASALLAELERRRAERPTAGAVEAVEHCLEATTLRELCLEWGDGRRRVANLDALRALAVGWAETRAAEGRAGTPEGLVTHLDAVAGIDDDQSADDDDTAVTVSTWHASKGLEWPVTVLYAADTPREDTAWGVSIASDGAFELAAPLAGRWIRFWPNPYGGNTSGPVLDAMNAAPEVQEHLATQRREQLRVLYVGWTRARDRLVLASRADKFLDGRLSVLRGAGAAPLLQAPAPAVTWAGRPVEPHLREASIVEESPVALAPSPGTNAAGPRAHPPAKTQPSGVDAPGHVTTAHRVGPRFTLRCKSDQMNAVGTAVHNFLAADVPGLPDAERHALAARQLDAQAVTGALRTEDLVEASNRLRAFVEARWPGATWHREWPVAMRLPNGSLLAGTADLVLETAEGFVVVDHKTFPGRDEDAEGKAAGYAGQLAAYADAITAATRRPVLALAVHLPVLGLVCEVERRAAERAA